MADENNTIEAEVSMRHESTGGSVNEAEENTPLLASSDTGQQSSHYVGYKSTYIK